MTMTMMRMIRRASLHTAVVASPSSSSSQKLYRARLNTLIYAADRLLLTPRADTLEHYLIRRLSDDKFDNAYRSIAFVRLIRFCLQRHLFDVALALRDRMCNEGFLLVHALSLRMSALKIAQQVNTPNECVSQLKKLFENTAYDVPAFMDLVRYLTDDRHASGALVDDIAHAFVSIRQIKLSEYPDLVGELASINMRVDRLDAAQKWLQVFEDTCGAQGILPDVTPYSDIITTLNHIDPTNTDAIQDVLVRMKSAGVSPNTNVFNALIRVNFVQQRYQEAFALYHVLMQKRSDELMPNDVTYKMLFRATHLLSNTRKRRRRPENAVPPRRLFQSMLACHLEQTHGRPLQRSTVMSVSAFHLALRTFMARQDYAAAFVLIHALHAFGFQPTLQTYLIVFVDLLHRMKLEANLPRPDDEGVYRLVDFLTHLRPDEDPDLDTLMHRIRNGPSSVGIDTVSHLLSLSLGSHPPTDDVPTLPRLPSKSRHAQVQVPTVAMLTGAKDPASQRAFFSPLPLARIVHKALLGELFRKAVHRGVDWDWKGAVMPIIDETRREMVPEDVTWEQEEERRTEKAVLPFAAARMKRRRRGARGTREVAFDFE